ncbi:MAG: rhomboid family intramembrane serine protease [Flavobacteriales bacterium]
MSVLNELKYRYKTGGVYMQLIFLNGIAFVLLLLVRLLFYLANHMAEYFLLEQALMISSDPILVLSRPWSLLTHMFVHQGVWHLVVNMLWLNLGGMVFMHFHTTKRLISTYFLSGLAGVLLMLLALNLIPRYTDMNYVVFASGASAAVLGIVVAAATTAPDFNLKLFLVGNVKLKWIALFAVVSDILFLPEGNEGGRFGHLGGALFGYLYIRLSKNGTDLTVDFLKPWYWIKEKLAARKKPIQVVHRKPKNDYEYNASKANVQEQIDTILDKIKRSGYESLSKKEKEILFKNSKEI